MRFRGGIVDERALLEQYRPWLTKVAHGMASPDRATELVQEGWIELWKATKTWDGKSPLDWWLKYKARGRMVLMVTVRWKAAKEAQYVPADDDWFEQALTVSLDGIELAYHHGEIQHALNQLTPREREYVYLRFWRGWQKPQLIGFFGYEPNGLWRTARTKLKASLAHLGAVVDV
jgi:RNA polymerase sigma factor (sigma-70 family)